ncbi:glycine/D-amino acid oxidase-like deaminating enzyme [Rhodoligotrophos appendicifer]|uniref:NAD(P)/FAD-dependent oxidoreductase n=1 Tax=Rhodoligotrophos appendicifer TaxID=987056 RepID=UPI00117E5154|nr:FAD-binding oxidoreductase [Rhodoligotrophos appendicifer]
MPLRKPYGPPEQSRYDVVIIGGAVMGSATAYFLSHNPDFAGSILVVERDSTYEFASTSRSTSSIRQQFSNPINVKISQFGVDFIRAFPETMGPEAPDLSFKENGYLICCTDAGVETVRELVDMQRSLGAHTVFLTPGQILERFPYVNVEDLAGGSWGSKAEGWFDANGLMQGFRRAARKSGAEYIENEVVGLVRETNAVTTVLLSTGERIACGTVVNTAGSRGPGIARMIGLEIPVEPRRRHSFIFSCATPIPGAMPNVIDISGTFVRPEGDYFLTGNTPLVDGEADIDDFETVHEEFEERIWPSLAHRIPPFESIRVTNFWTGHYDYNTMDHNAIVGRHPEVTNFIFANGFSGHGLQQSPAVGRGISELITYGGYRTLDLSPMRYERVPANEPFLEQAVI